MFTHTSLSNLANTNYLDPVDHLTALDLFSHSDHCNHKSSSIDIVKCNCFDPIPLEAAVEIIEPEMFYQRYQELKNRSESRLWRTGDDRVDNKKTVENVINNKVFGSCENVMDGPILEEKVSCSGNKAQKSSTKIKSISKSSRPIESHSYHDFANVPKSVADHAYLVRNYSRDSIHSKMLFPLKLHKMLYEVYKIGLEDIVCWQQHGRCFKINQPGKMKPILDLFFGGSKYSSFQRNLNIYGFKRITCGPDAGSYYHELFLRNHEHLCGRMKRIAVKGTQTRLASNPNDEPKFNSMSPISDFMLYDVFTTT